MTGSENESFFKLEKSFSIYGVIAPHLFSPNLLLSIISYKLPTIVSVLWIYSSNLLPSGNFTNESVIFEGSKIGF